MSSDFLEDPLLWLAVNHVRPAYGFNAFAGAHCLNCSERGEI